MVSDGLAVGRQVRRKVVGRIGRQALDWSAADRHAEDLGVQMQRRIVDQPLLVSRHPNGFDDLTAARQSLRAVVSIGAPEGIGSDQMFARAAYVTYASRPPLDANAIDWTPRPVVTLRAASCAPSVAAHVNDIDVARPFAVRHEIQLMAVGRPDRTEIRGRASATVTNEPPLAGASTIALGAMFPNLLPGTIGTAVAGHAGDPVIQRRPGAGVQVGSPLASERSGPPSRGATASVVRASDEHLLAVGSPRRR